MFPGLQNKQQQKYGEDVIPWRHFYSYLSFMQVFYLCKEQKYNLWWLTALFVMKQVGKQDPKADMNF